MKSAAQYSKERREHFKQQGLCIECGEKPAETNKTRCDICAQAQREANERYRKNNVDKIIKRRKDWNLNGKFGDRTRASQKKQRLLLRKKVIEKYGNKCSCCGESTYEFLQIDHLNKDGKQHRTEVGRGMKLHRDMLKDNCKFNIRILCGNCHNAVTAHGKCPHEEYNYGITQIQQNVPPTIQ